MFLLQFEFWFPPFICCLWLTIFYIAARLGGWHALGLRFRATDEPPGERFAWASVSMGASNYGGCTTIVVSAQGLYLKLFAPFRFFHPPLLIPWSEIHVQKIHQGWFVSYALIEVGQPVLASVTLPLKIIEAASEYLLQAGEQPGDHAGNQEQK